MSKSFNRTFMELKLFGSDEVSKIKCVSIVPLWNWNTTRDGTSRPGTGFNRTFMELKCVPLPCPRTNFLCFNRTFMELKFWEYTGAIHFLVFQSYLYGIEIKNTISYKRIKFVSIVPLWNWNLDWRWKGRKDFTVSIVPLWNWNFLA